MKSSAIATLLLFVSLNPLAALACSDHEKDQASAADKPQVSVKTTQPRKDLDPQALIRTDKVEPLTQICKEKSCDVPTKRSKELQSVPTTQTR